MKKFPVALQLYSVRDAMAEDFEGTLAKVAEMGYQGVEFAGLFDKSAEEIRGLCDKYGLTPISAHVPYSGMLADENLIATYAAIGCKFIAIPWYDWKFAPDGESFEQFIANVVKLGEECKKNGITLLYHNHDFEFEKMDGEYRLDRLYSAVPADLLQTQLDMCWVNVGGENPAEYLRKYTGRAPVVHLKDFAGQKSDKMYALIGVDDGDQKAAEPQAFEFRPVGYGLQKFPEILEAATDAGAQWVVVEQDMPSMGKTPLECAATSREYLKTLGL
ncbi:MAG: sugar phosphate isomerase/epimerase [Ruminococcaceae bacterium]|nr:sugar phosphate isomerase/epimerase [Oscillospiraceae bacterium]